MADEPILGNTEKDIFQKCKEEIDAVMKKHACMFDVGILIRAGYLPEAFIKIIRQPNKLVVPPLTTMPNFESKWPGGKA
jgi:hypothetical protein